MKRLLLWIVILTILFSGGITLAARAGRDAPLPAFAQWFTDPDGKPCPMPCFLGLRLGEGKIDDAQTVLQAHPLGNGMKTINIYDGPKIPFVSVSNAQFGLRIIGDENRTIRSIRVETGRNNRVMLHHVFQALGVPARVSLAGYNGYYLNVFVFPNVAFVDTEINERYFSCRLDLSIPIGRTYVYTDESDFDTLAYAVTDTTFMYFAKSSSTVPFAGLSRKVYWSRFYASRPNANEVECKP